MGELILFASYAAVVLIAFRAMMNSETWKTGRLKSKKAEFGKPPTGNRPWPLPDDGHEDWRDNVVGCIHVTAKVLALPVAIGLMPFIFGF